MKKLWLWLFKRSILPQPMVTEPPSDDRERLELESWQDDMRHRVRSLEAMVESVRPNPKVRRHEP